MPTRITEADRFDLNAWITEARPNVRQVTVYNRPDLVERVNALSAAPDDDRPRTYKAAAPSAELRDAVEEMERHAITVAIKSNSDTDVQTARAAAKAGGANPDDQEASAPYHLAQNIVDVYAGPERPYGYGTPHTTLTAAQVKSLRTALGEAQFTKLYLAMVAVSNSAPEPSPDFSRPSSRDHGTPTP